MESNGYFRFEEFFFCSDVIGMYLLYQNLLHLSSFETLILKRVLILSGSLVVPGNDEDRGEYQKGRFLIRLDTCLSQDIRTPSR
jgi:hypothetical protein